MLLLDDTLITPAVSDTVASAAEKTAEASQSYWDLAVQGGWIMIVLAVLSVLAIYIFIDKYLAMRKASKNQDGFMQNIKNYIKEGKIDQAIDNCRSNNSPISRMIEKGIQRIGRPLNDVNTAIENVGKQEIAKLEKGLALLATIAGGAPMIGFFGTVTGMVQSFSSMAAAGNALEITDLAGGIETALVTTVGGLFVGIIAYFAYNILVAKVNNLVNDLESKTTEFMDVLNEPV
ncbi:MAG: MotA/TolQ/ExbB proton channel family protein [Bacteroidales bacterium]|nr:MotA/TolQ/ExbB proton channel family protein [Bacteroidales bacterium]